MVRRILKTMAVRFLLCLGLAVAGSSSFAQDTTQLLWDRTPGPVPVRLETASQQTSLVFAWQIPVAAAVFVRAGILWIVFDEPGQLDTGSLGVALAGRLVPLTTSSDPRALILRFRIEGSPNIKVARQGNSWKITLSNLASDPDRLISLAQAETGRKGARIFVPMEQPGLQLKIHDPAQGDLIHVIPTLSASSGVVRGRDFGRFGVLRSAQGLVVEKAVDDVVVARFANGVTIGTAKLLDVSPAPLPAGADVISVMDRTRAPTRLIDLESWRLGPLTKFNANQRMLNRRLSSAAESRRNARRWDLARFYLAHRMYVEAQAYLTQMVSTGEADTSDPKYKAVQALVALGFHDGANSLLLISTPELDAEPEIPLWRSRVLEGLGRYEAALATFEAGRGALALIGPADLAEFHIAAFRAAVMVGQGEKADRQANLLRQTLLSDSQKAEVDFLNGRLKESRGAIPEAMALYAAIADGAVRPASGKAGLALVNLQLSRGDIEPGVAIEALERVRLSWRGDPFELQLAGVLGRLYLDRGQPRTGLNALRRAVVRFPSHPDAEALTVLMSEAFRQLFLDGTFEDLGALSTLALYSEFRELTPLGAEGDRMIRRLAEKLVALDLLDKASGLLAHQVRFRSEGVERAEVAARLAEVYILDRAPEQALNILEQTDQPGLPTAVVRPRNRVKSRALLALESFDEAEAVLRGDNGRAANLIRAEIYWRIEQWPELILAGNRLLASKAGGAVSLAHEDRRVLIRHAVALTKVGDRAALDRVRRAFVAPMRSGPWSYAFDLLTQPAAFDAASLRDLVTTTSSVTLLQGFMRQYRQEFETRGVAAGQ